MQTVLITGAGIGIGRAAALAFAAAGYRVIVTDVVDDGRAVAERIAADGGEAEFHRLDVTSTPDADALVSDLEARHGALDCIVANAGIAHRVPLEEMTDEKWTTRSTWT